MLHIYQSRIQPSAGVTILCGIRGLEQQGDKVCHQLASERAEGSRCCAGSLHVLVHGAISGELGLSRCQLEVKVVDCEYDDNY